MNKQDSEPKFSAIRDAIHEKRERKPIAVADIDALEASLMADIEAFDLDAAERLARREQAASEVAGMVNSKLAFPEIVPVIPRGNRLPLRHNAFHQRFQRFKTKRPACLAS